MQPFPHTCLLPLLEPTPAAHPRAAAHLLGQHLPGYATLEHEDDAGEGGPVVDARPTALGLGWLFGQQRLDRFPKFVCNEFFSHTITLPATRFC
jgi:hypothetical protein